MVNPVGSSKKFAYSKLWTKKWLEFKKDLHLKEDQISVLIGSMLGDGTLRIGDGAVNANFKTEHGLKQKEYVFWKYRVFEKWVGTPPKISYRYRENGERYEKSWWFRTVRHPEITHFYKLFYPKNKKIIPKNIESFLDSLSLAVWVMDDGNRSGRSINLSTYAFSLSEIKRIQKALKDRFCLESSFRPDRDKGYRMYFNVQNTKKLVKIIFPYILPSMYYKLPRTP